MPRYLRGSEIDLDEAYGALLDQNAPLQRNIRTGISMSRIHHCEDPECGGRAPKLKCILRGHIAFCLAPVIDQDPTSGTFGEVTIHGERFAVLSAQGCGEHHYTDGFNVDIKDARNGRPNFPIRWKQRIKDFKAQYEAEAALEAMKREAMQKQLGMTGHQRQTRQARQDREEHLRRREVEVARIVRECSDSKLESNMVPDSDQESARQLSRDEVLKAGELAVQVRAVTLEEIKSVVVPLWLYGQLFSDPDAGNARGGEFYDGIGASSFMPVPHELAIPTEDWLHDQLFRDVEVDEEKVEHRSLIVLTSPEGPPQNVEQSRDAIDSAAGQPRRRERKEVKKQEAAKARAYARTMAEEATKKEAEERELTQAMKAQRGGRNKRVTGAGRTARI
jgi:hypothetical protein